jgi:uncharacterized membrane protein
LGQAKSGEEIMITPTIILLLLVSPLAIAYFRFRVSGQSVDVQKFSCWGLGIAFIFFSIGHVAKTQGMVEMLPSWVPFRIALVYLTGLLELVVGIALFMPKYQVVAAKAAIVIFVVFFPANIYAAVNGVGLGGHQWGPLYLLIRAPLQIILIAWAYFLCAQGYNKLRLLD